MLTLEQAMEIFKKRDITAIQYAKQKKERFIPTPLKSAHPLVRRVRHGGDYFIQTANTIIHTSE